MGGMVREFDRMVTHRPPVLCAAHVQYLGRGLAAAGYGAHCNNNAVEVNNRRLKDQRKVEAGAIPELDLKRLISSKVTSTLKISFRPPSDPPLACRVVDRPAAGIIHPRHRAVRCSSHFQCAVYIQPYSYSFPVQDANTTCPGTTSRLSLQAPGSAPGQRSHGSKFLHAARRMQLSYRVG